MYHYDYTLTNPIIFDLPFLGSLEILPFDLFCPLFKHMKSSRRINFTNPLLNLSKTYSQQTKKKYLKNIILLL